MAIALSTAFFKLHMNCSSGLLSRANNLASFRNFVRISRETGCCRTSCGTVFSFKTSLSLTHVSLRFASKSVPKRPFEIDTNIPKNVLIFSNNNTRFHRLLTIFGLVQITFWGYLSYFSYSNFRDEERPKPAAEDTWLNIIDAGRMKYKNALSVLFLSIGYVVLYISILYPLRSIHQLWLLKGGNNVGVSTFGMFGRKRSFTIPVNYINCLQARTGSGSQIPLKLKGKWFFFLMDKRGVFHNTKLFDYSVGLHRQLKK